MSNAKRTSFNGRGPLLAVSTVIVLLFPAQAANSVPASGLERPAPGVVLNEPTPPTIYEDATTQLTGHLSHGGAGKLVVLRKRVAHAWTRVGTTRTDAQGSFALAYSPALPGVISLQATHRTAQG